MTKLSNPTAGPKGVWVSDKNAAFAGKTVWVEPGETVEVDGLAEPEADAFRASGGVVEVSVPPEPKRGPGRPPKAAE